MRSDPPEHIVVAGDGAVGLAAAIALRRALPRTTVSAVPCPADPRAFADAASSSLPSSTAFHERIGLDEAGFVARTGGSHRLAARFSGWGAPRLVAYGAACDDPAQPSVSQALASAGRFAHPADDVASPLSDIDYALRFNPEAYTRRLLALAAHVGVTRIASSLKAGVADGQGELGHVVLDSGEAIAADLFIDCSGPSSILANAVGAVFDGWSRYLPCDQIMRAAQPDAPILSVVDEVAALSTGWRLQTNGRDGVHNCFGYHAASGSEAGNGIAFTPGRLCNAWNANVIAIGDSATCFEPLHSGNMALAHAQILLLLDLLPGAETTPLERSEYNRRAGNMADRIRDYHALFHCGANAPEGAYWQHASTLERPASLSLTLSEYARRGRLPFFEDDILPRDAWVSAMACIGVAPGKSALALSLSHAEIEHAERKQHLRSTAALGLAPPYQHWLSHYIETHNDRRR